MSLTDRVMDTVANTDAKVYIGTRTLKAWPATRGEYNAYRGWTPPEGEDQDVAGYLVEYLDGSTPNDPRHGGYISWSPADVFERTYTEVGETGEQTQSGVHAGGSQQAETVSDWRTNLRNEAVELDHRLLKLRKFIQTEAFAVLPQTDKDLLHKQASYMSKYLDILAQRDDGAHVSEIENAERAAYNDRHG